MSQETKLTRPTVGEVVAFLQTLDQSLPLRLRDEDTQYYCIEIIKVEMHPSCIILGGNYFEMVSGFPGGVA